MNNELRKTIQKNLKKYRKEKGFTQSDVAKKLNSTKTTIASWEQGKSLPSIETAYKLMMLYGLKIDDLFKNNDEVIL